MVLFVQTSPQFAREQISLAQPEQLAQGQIQLRNLQCILLQNHGKVITVTLLISRLHRVTDAGRAIMGGRCALLAYIN
jgi:hypothetical protein